MTKTELVLFDLDGTLVDTAPDFCTAINLLLQEEDQPTMAAESLRPHVSAGSYVMLSKAFSIPRNDASMEALKSRFLQHYLNHLVDLSRVFTGVDSLLATIEERGIHWGIVTNKPEYLAKPLLLELGLWQRSICVISGDTLAVKKPEPEPLLKACEVAAATPKHTLFVGDSIIDIQSANAAGIPAIAAGYGYIANHENPKNWNALAVIDSALEVLDYL